MRFEPDDVSTMLPFEEVVAALRRRSERDLGLQTIRLDSIVGSVDRQRRGFDRKFRPTSTGVRGRWEGIAAARRRGQALSRSEIAEAWLHGEYEPVLEVLRETGFGGEGTEAERYLRIATLRYLLLRTHEWTDEVIERLLGEVRSSPSVDDTVIHRILKEMR